MTQQRKHLTRQLDKLWQQAICAKGICERCGDIPVSGHHLIKRAHHWHRHNLANGVALCVCCHGMAHERPEAFGKWLATYDAARYGYWQANRHDRSAGPVPLGVLREWRELLNGNIRGNTADMGGDVTEREYGNGIETTGQEVNK